MGTHKRYSSPISPMTVPQSAQSTSPTFLTPPWSSHTPEFYPPKEINWSNCNSNEASSRTLTSMPFPLDWSPFHVFNTRPRAYLIGEQNPLLKFPESVAERVIARQKNMFDEIEFICTNAAKKFWCKQSSGASSLPPISHHDASSLSQGFQQDVSSRVSETLPGCEAGQNNALMEYIQRVNDILLRRTIAIAGEHDAVITESLSRIMKLLTWAEQVKSLAEMGGYSMSDHGIEEAVKGVRDLTYCLLDLEGEIALEKLWKGKRIDRGLVFCGEDTTMDADRFNRWDTFMS
ncbi:MAG: hypothetical protein Q9216_000368 [Gyalolechia sp. 2 TL-2023]